MNIYLSVNNNAEVLQLPLMPPEFTVSKPQSITEFETVSKKDLALIGTPKLKTIGWNSFFPVRDYPFLKNRAVWGWDYTYKIDKWIEQKLPIRLIITDTPVNMACEVSDFSYSIGTDGNLNYDIEFKEFNLLGYENIEEDGEVELTAEEYNSLLARLDYLEGVVNDLSNPMIYNYIDENMPEWAHEAVQAAVDCGALSGTGDGWGLSYGDLRIITMMYRAGAFG